MPLESAPYINSLNASNPTGADTKAEGDDHIRLIKSAVKATFPNLTGAVTADQSELNILDGATLSTAELNLLDGVTASTAELNLLDGVTATTTEINYINGVTSPIQTQFSGVQSQLSAKADITGETYTGTHDFSGATAVKAPTKSPGSAGNDVATVDYANSLAFSSALPALTGNALKVLRVNAGATSGEWVDYIPTPAGNEGKPLAVNSSGASAWISPQSTWSLWSLITTNSGTITVPDGVSSIRAYVFGKGGSGSANVAGGAGGGGGGCTFGTIPCKPGDVFTFDNTSGAALKKGATAYLSANNGGNASGTTAGTGATAGSVGGGLGITSSGAYGGGDGCVGGGGAYGGGGSSGSPIGTGITAVSSSGAGWGAAGSSSGGGGGVATNPTGYHLGGPAPMSNGYPTSRDWTNAFSDPLLRFCNGVTAPWSSSIASSSNQAAPAPAGCGGDISRGGASSRPGGSGGLGGGGGAGSGTNAAGGNGGFGGGGAYGTGTAAGGNSLLGGGGGGTTTGSVGTSTAGVIIFYS